MFLAWREIKQNKLRFALITAVLLLVSFLVFFLSGLASGLAGLNREAVDKWQSDTIYLTEESDKSLNQSMMTAEKADEVEGGETAVLAEMNLIADNGEAKNGVALFGIRQDEFIMPKVTEGKPFKDENEVIASDYLRDEGFSVGDELSLSSTDEKLTITGFTDKSRFNAAPVLYMDLPDSRRSNSARLQNRWKKERKPSMRWS